MASAGFPAMQVDLLRAVPTLSLDDPQSVFLGQFGRQGDLPGYLDDGTVPKGSRCPTFAATVLKVGRLSAGESRPLP